MDISVVIPTYMRTDLLLQCLRCLGNQTLEKTRFEVLVVSDGHDEITHIALARVTGIAVTYLHTEGKKGPAAARNLGWKHANSPLVAFTDDDCRPEPGWLAAFLNHYKGEELAAFSGFTHVPAPDNPTDFALNTKHLQNAAFITANCACTRHALMAAHGFDERFETAWREDSDLEFRFLELGIPVTRINEAVVIHPVREQIPWGVSIKEQRKGLYDALLFKKYPHLYRSRIQSSPPWNYYAIVLACVCMLGSLILPDYRITVASAFILAILVLAIFIRRISATTKEPSHVIEMLVTSIIIPFVSVYWRLYGDFKYRVFFI